MNFQIKNLIIKPSTISEAIKLNYLHYGSFHLQLLKRAKITQPELYDAFNKRNCVVKRTPGSFNAVSPDLAVE